MPKTDKLTKNTNTVLDNRVTRKELINIVLDEAQKKLVEKKEAATRAFRELENQELNFDQVKHLLGGAKFHLQRAYTHDNKVTWRIALNETQLTILTAQDPTMGDFMARLENAQEEMRETCSAWTEFVNKRGEMTAAFTKRLIQTTPEGKALLEQLDAFIATMVKE